MTVASTRKMPVRINKAKRTTYSGEHLVPSLADLPEGFVSMKTGKCCERGAVVFLGKKVSLEMMLERYCQVAVSPNDREAALRRLAEYCDALQSTKIGNVVSISFDSDGGLLLHIEEKYFLSRPETRSQ
jgi:hypothetical protein